MKSFINLLRNLLISYQMYRHNRCNNGFHYISEYEFNSKVVRTKPIIIIS